MKEMQCSPVKPTTQDVMIDLPGETIQCWRSSDNIRVILRKQRDVFFDIHLKPGRTYTVESKSDFYVPKTKKLVRKAQFKDGEAFHLWVGREFKGKIVLKGDGVVLGSYEPNVLDPKRYGADPKIKPEPLMVVMDQRDVPASFSCTPQDMFGAGSSLNIFKPQFDPKLGLLKDYGSTFDYRYPAEVPEIQEYACVTEALPHEIQPQVLRQLDSGIAVVGTPAQIFVPPARKDEPSDLYTALGATGAYISGNAVFTANWFKESAGYIQEHWRALNRLSMKVRVERRVIGKYRVIFKGRPLTRVAAEAFGAAALRRPKVEKIPLGDPRSAFIDGGYQRTGRDGFKMKRILLTASDNFKGGMKIQIIGTVIDIIGDATTVFGGEKGSKDLSEFLGRAGVSIAKAGATAAIGSILAAGGLAGVALFASAPVWVTVGVIVGGYILAATLVDKMDETFDIKNTVGNWAR
jgi:hypothetical protein